MKKKFYSHIVELDSLLIALEDMELSPEEKKHLHFLLESNLHHEILDAILSQLSEEDKKIFLTHLNEEDKEKIWKHLKEKIENIEEKIKKTAEEVKKQLHQDIKEVNKK